MDIGRGMSNFKAELLSFASDYCSRRCSSSSLRNMFLDLFWHKGHVAIFLVAEVKLGSGLVEACRCFNGMEWVRF